MALFIVWFQDTSEFSIPGHVESSISSQHNQSGAVVSPANHILNKNHTFTKLKKYSLRMPFGGKVTHLKYINLDSWICTLGSSLPLPPQRGTHFTFRICPFISDEYLGHSKEKDITGERFLFSFHFEFKDEVLWKKSLNFENKVDILKDKISGKKNWISRMKLMLKIQYFVIFF